MLKTFFFGGGGEGIAKNHIHEKETPKFCTILHCYHSLRHRTNSGHSCVSYLVDLFVDAGCFTIEVKYSDLPYFIFNIEVTYSDI